MNDEFKKFAEEFITTEIPDEVMDTVVNYFFSLMRKHGIKHGTKDEDGNIHMANFEWTLCKNAFAALLIQEISYRMIFNIPEDLEC